jgi:CAAX protease family protein
MISEPLSKAAPMRPQAKKELILFFVLTLGLMYGLCFSYVAFKVPLKVFFDHHLGGIDPFIIVYPAAYSPTLIAIVLTAVFGGWVGTKRLFRNIFRWRVPGKWWLVSLFGVPGIWLLIAVIRHFASGAPVHWEVWYYQAPMLFLGGYLFTDTGGLGEETGWRGFALPRLLERYNPVLAGIIVGFFFGVWHLPGWFLSNLHYKSLDFGMFVCFTMAISILFAYFYVNMRGSVLLAGILPHMEMNIGSEGMGMYKSTWEYFGYFAIVLLVLLAVQLRQLAKCAPPFEKRFSPQFYDAED